MIKQYKQLIDNFKRGNLEEDHESMNQRYLAWHNFKLKRQNKCVSLCKVYQLLNLVLVIKQTCYFLFKNNVSNFVILLFTIRFCKKLL